MRNSEWRITNGYEVYMLIIGVLGKLFIFLQFGTMIREQASKDVSVSSYLVYILSSISWFLLGVLYRDMVLTVSGMFGVVSGFLALITAIYYKENKNALL